MRCIDFNKVLFCSVLALFAIVCTGQKLSLDYAVLQNFNKNAHLTERLSSVSVILKEQFSLNHYYMRVHNTYSRPACLRWRGQ